MRQITIKFSNRVFYTFVLIGVLILAGVIVYAYGGNQPSVVGHSADEIEPPTGCSSNQVLQWSGSAWQCVNLLDPNSIQISGIGRMYDGEVRGCQGTVDRVKYQAAIRDNKGVLEIRFSAQRYNRDTGWQRTDSLIDSAHYPNTETSLNENEGTLSVTDITEYGDSGPSSYTLMLNCDLFNKSCFTYSCFYFDSWTDIY